MYNFYTSQCKNYTLFDFGKRLKISYDMINFYNLGKRHSTAHNGTKTMHHTPCACAFWKRRKTETFFFWEKVKGQGDE